jgi:hypothetical protein
MLHRLMGSYLNNLVTRDFLTPLDQEQVMQTQRDEARRKQQEVGPSHQGDTLSHPDRLELSIDDFELCSMELRKPHDQNKVSTLKAWQRASNRSLLTILPKPHLSSNDRRLSCNSMKDKTKQVLII